MKHKINLLEEGPDLSASKERTITKNFSWADVWLRSTTAKRAIDKIKQGEYSNAQELKNYLLALYVMRKVAQSKKYSEKKKDRALELLKNSGVDLTNLKPDDQKLIRQSNNMFSQEYKTVHKKGEEPAEVPAEKKPEEKPVEAPAKAPEVPAEKKPEEKPAEKKPEEKPAEPETPKSEIERDLEKTGSVKPELATKEIRKLKNDSSKYIEQIINGLKASKDIMAKRNLAKTTTLLKHFERTMSKYEDKAGLGPKNAAIAYNKAKTDAKIAKLQADRNTMKGAVRLGAEGTVKALKGAVEKAKQTSANIRKKISSNEQIKRASNIYKKVKENIKGAATKGVETLSSRIRQKQIDNLATSLKKAGVNTGTPLANQDEEYKRLAALAKKNNIKT